MVYIIVINASLLVISVFAGFYALFRHTDFPKGLTDDEIENYRTIAQNHSKKVRGCACATLVQGAVYYVLIPALLIVFKVSATIACISAALLAFVQMAVIQLVFTAMSDKLNV